MMATKALPKAPLISIKLVRESRRKYEPVKVVTPDCVTSLLEHMKELAQEQFVVLHLNSQNEITGFQVISQGTLGSSLVHPREVFKGAILANSHAIMVAHNHPSGSCTPSLEDLETTQQLIEAGNLLGIPVLDHFVVGDEVLSIREHNCLLWKGKM